MPDHHPKAFPSNLASFAVSGGGGGGPGGGGGGGPGGGPGGLPPGGLPPPEPIPTQGCSSNGVRDTGAMPGPGLGNPQDQIDYDDSFFSFVGCRCNSGYDNVYTIDTTGS